MLDLQKFIPGCYDEFPLMKSLMPWEVTQNLPAIIEEFISFLDQEFSINNGIAIHKTAKIENGATLKPPMIISENCLIASTSYLRGGSYLGNKSIVGPGCEIKTTIMFRNSVAAHLNFIGDSIIGHDVNFEAGSLTANHYNERDWKEISVLYEGKILKTGTTRFGSLIGDHARIGANAVLAPGSLLEPGAVIQRLKLLDQLSELNK